MDTQTLSELEPQEAGVAISACSEPVRRKYGFQKGVSGNPGGKSQGRSKRDAPALLKAMRRASVGANCSEDGKKRTIIQKRMIEWLERDPRGFWAKLADLEKAWLVAGAKAAVEKKGKGPEKSIQESISVPVVVVEADLGAERVGELIERLLREAQPG